MANDTPTTSATTLDTDRNPTKPFVGVDINEDGSAYVQVAKNESGMRQSVPISGPGGTTLRVDERIYQEVTGLDPQDRAARFKLTPEQEAQIKSFATRANRDGVIDAQEVTEINNLTSSILGTHAVGKSESQQR